MSTYKSFSKIKYILKKKKKVSPKLVDVSNINDTSTK
jgi:hypothetical protein